MTRHIAALLALSLAGTSAHAATIVVVNGDGFNEGLNDSTPRQPQGGNPGTSLGEQRLIALQAAANVWGERLVSNVQIAINARFDPIAPCDATSATVGSAGASSQLNFGAAPPPGAQADTFYPIALAEALAGSNLNGGNVEIVATFNSDVDGPTCFGPKGFYYGIETGNVPPTALAFFPVALHEIGHGLGFASLVCTRTTGCDGVPFGAFLNEDDVPDIWARLLRQLPSTTWSDMSDAQRAASMTADPALVWTGPLVTAGAGGLVHGTNGGFVRMHAPAMLAPGSSVSHFSSDVLPDEIMEPVINLNSVQLDPGRGVPLMRDIGWTLVDGGAPPLFTDGFE